MRRRLVVVVAFQAKMRVSGGGERVGGEGGRVLSGGGWWADGREGEATGVKLTAMSARRDAATTERERQKVRESESA